MSPTPLPDPTPGQINHARQLLSVGRDFPALKLAARLAELRIPEAFEIGAQAARNLGLPTAALDIVNDGLTHHPGNCSLTFQRALILLGEGRFAEGWPDYEYRLKTRQWCYLPRRVTFPRWNGPMENPLTGKTILVWGEQGYGDEIMFASMIPDLVRMGARVTLECSRDLWRLFAQSFSGVEVIPHDLNGQMPEQLAGRTFDYESPIASLAQHLRPDWASFASEPGAYLAPDSAEQHFYYNQLRAVDEERRPIIGLAWRGGTTQTRRVARSIELSVLLAALQMHGPYNAQYVSLQHDMTREESLTLKFSAFPLVFADDVAVKDFCATAALIQCCDAVISTCGTVVHLAGALGRPVHVIAPHAPEWRYGFRFSRMPWYENVHVHRQTRPGEWADCLRRAISGAFTH